MQKLIVQPEGNFYDKYNSKNPIVRWMMKGFFRDLESLLNGLEGTAPEKILEAGCGEGKVTAFLHAFYPHAVIDAFDVSERVIRQAAAENPDVNFYVGDVYTLKAARHPDQKESLMWGGYGLVVCCEVMEHLEFPKKALDMLMNASSAYVLLSVPNEPIWRILNMCRGKYLKHLGNTPGHIQHWSSKQFCKMLIRCGYQIVGVKKPFPWTMVMIKK